MKPINILIGIAIAAVLLKQGYDEYRQYSSGETALLDGIPSLPNPAPEQKRAETHSSLFQCDGRTQCGEMSSCEEAKFFLKHCPNTQMDGDLNGIPCEKNVCL